MSLLFIGIVILISALVIFYRKEYMAGDKTEVRFILLVLIFVLSIMFLIISPNLIRILLGWDGLGLVSYCLVIYYQNVKSYNAGMLTALRNRVGDVAILMSLAWILNFGSFNYIFYINITPGAWELRVVISLMILAAITKSAQIPFSAWLPAAMAAPTPVSALVHSSTLVTAGVYLLIRFRRCLEQRGMAKYLLVVGGLTIFMAGLGANFEFDLKKIIALSTLRQLGLIVRILAIGFPKIAYFHLLSHALFKALLFMCAGVIIHNIKNSQDIRNMGRLVILMPYTRARLNVANMALCGVPFIAGFYSKDLILEMGCMEAINVLIFFLYFVSTGLTMCYTVRLRYYSLRGLFKRGANHPIQDETQAIFKSMICLVIGATLGGSILRWILFSSPLIVCLPFSLKILALVVTGLGAWLGWEINKINFNFKSYTRNFYNLVVFWGSMWFIPLLFTLGVRKNPLYLGASVVKSGDQGWLELMGAQGLFRYISRGAVINQWAQQNDLKVYIFTFFLWFVFLLVQICLNSL